MKPQPLKSFKKQTIEKVNKAVEKQESAKALPIKLTSVQKRSIKHIMMSALEDWIKTGKLGEY